MFICDIVYLFTRHAAKQINNINKQTINELFLFKATF